MVPRLWARARMIATRQLRSLAAAGFFFGGRIPLHTAAGANCDGFAIEVLVELVRGGLATAQTERVVGLNMVPSCTTVGRFCLADSRLTGAELISPICRERSGHRRRPGMARLPIWRTLASRGRERTYSS
jgi:hypothetical protein